MPMFRIGPKLSLGGKLCLRDDKILRLYKQASIENVTLSARILYKQEAVSDWLNPHSLGTMSAFGCIDNWCVSLDIEYSLA